MDTTQTKPLAIEGIRNILSNLNFASHSMLDFDWDFQVGVTPSPEQEEGALLLMRTSFMRKDIDTGKFEKGWGRWHTTPYEGITEKSVVMTAWVCVKMIIEHELLEGFEYHNAKIFNPHNSLESLVWPKALPENR